ncbi:hypothetical protein [Dankookia sp. P2]|uniref:hypothetical protein n=1 Tax=Dankookia sp. P2 TaxID=3423955 RepID=UPI003D667DA9
MRPISASSWVPPWWSIRQPASLRSRRRRGAGLVILNRQETGLDGIADLVIHAGIGDVLGGAVGVN